VSALTPLAGEHAGLGALRTAAAALAVTGSPLPRLPELSEPIRPDLRFVTAPSEGGRVRPKAAMVHGLARGGAHVALVLRASRSPGGLRASAEAAA
jgi:hypothetical protein